MSRSLVLRARIVLPALVIALIALAYVLPASARIAGLARSSHAAPDTVVVYGPKQATTPNGASTTTVEQFSASPASQGNGYLLRVSNGAAGGAGRVTEGNVVLNGAEVMSAAEVAAIPDGGAVFKPVVLQADNNTIVATVGGTAGAYLTLAIVTAPDPTFTVWGARTYERARGNAVTVTDRFTLPRGAGAPYFLYLTNGDGTRRSSSISVRINGAEVVTQSDLNEQVAGTVKRVVLQQDNVIAVTQLGAPGSRVTVRIAATDVAAPVLTLTSPTQNLVTNVEQLLVTGTVLEQTAVRVTANGVEAALQGSSNGVSGFSATIPLTTEGANTVTVTAIDAAGHQTDSVRTVIRDTEAPDVTVTSLPDTATVSADSSVVVQGAIHDRTRVTARLNGAPVAIDSVSGAYSVRVPLQNGVNFLTLVATDAAGNATTVVRQVTRDASPPTLYVTAPADSVVTKASTIHVTGSGTASTALTVTVNGIAVSLSATHTFAADVALNEGANSITVVGTTAAGVTATITRVVIRDTQAPTVTVGEPAEGLVTRNEAVTVSGSAVDATALSVTLNGAPVLLGANGAFSTNVALSEGPATLTLVATDAAGNATSVTRHVVRDATPPVITLQDPAPGALTRTAAYTVTGSVSDATAVTVTVNGVSAPVTADRSFSLGVTLVDGANAMNVVATDAAGNQSTASGSVLLDAAPPALTISAPATETSVTKTAAYTVSGTASDRTGVTVTVNGVPATIDGTGAFSAQVTLNEGANQLAVIATDGAGNSVTALRTVTLDTQAPALSVDSPADGTVPGSDGSVTVNGSVTDATAVTVTANGTALTVATDGRFAGAIAAAADAVVTIVATDAAGNAAMVTRTLGHKSNDGGIPPDPRTVAPPLNPTIANSVLSSTAFLYSGANPIQTGVAAGTITPYQAAVVRGRVTTRDGAPVSGVEVSVHGRPELGRTRTRLDGGYDLAVNGGEILTLSYSKTGLLPAQRQRLVRRQGWTTVDDVALVALDSNVTQVDLSQPAPVARGSLVTDASGTRQATLVFAQGTDATMVLPDGSTRPLNSLSVRVTEYTVGPNGPAAMPAELPPTSEYTYAAEFSADEAIAGGATSVRFSKPVSIYVENFIGFPVGGIVPMGSYDPQRAVWNPERNGRVIRVLSTTGGTATLDVNGSGTPASPDTLLALGVTDAELGRVAALYQPGQSLWRIPVSHFTTDDANWSGAQGMRPQEEPPRAGDGTKNKPSSHKRPRMRDTQCGSIIGCQRRTLGERVAIAGTTTTLVYSSDRVPGYRPDYSYDVPLSDNVPDSLLRVMSKILLRSSIAGRTRVDTFPAQRGLHGAVQWDGRDAYGRVVNGQARLEIEVGYVYTGMPYSVPVNDTAPVFARASGVNGYPSQRSPRVVWQTVLDELVGRWTNGSSALGGWSLGTHHAYDPLAAVAYFGDGEQKSAAGLNPMLSEVVFDPFFNANLVANPDGSIIEGSGERLYRVTRDGTPSVFAGTGSFSYSGDGVPATQAGIFAGQLARGPDGSIYFTDLNFYVRRIDPAGIITTIGGTGVGGSTGNGGAALTATFPSGGPIAVGPDGSVYVLGSNAPARGTHIRRIAPDGIVTRFAGAIDRACNLGTCPDSLPALDAPFVGSPSGIAVQRNGDVVIADTYTLWKIGTNGIRTLLTKPPTSYRCVELGDGVPSVSATICEVTAIATGPDGSIYIATNKRVRRIGPDGIITTVAGNGKTCFLSGTPRCPAAPAGGALQVPFPDIKALAVAADNSLFIRDNTWKRVARLGTALPGFDGAALAMTADDGSTLYRFDADGRHLATRDATTGATIERFAYDSTGALASVIDASGNVTTIERDARGQAKAIVGPFGQRTLLTLDGGGYLASVRAPGGETVRFSYDSLGLMSSRTDVGGAVHRFSYDPSGLLQADTNPDGLAQRLATTITPAGKQVTIYTGATEARSYLTETTPTGGNRSVYINAAGLATTSLEDPADSVKVTLPDGTRIATVNLADPRFGQQAPVPSMTVQLPSGLTRTGRITRAVTLANPADPLSLQTRVDSVIDNDAVATMTYNAAARTMTARSAEGRVTTTTLDSLGRIVALSRSGLASSRLTYDSLGRLRQASTGGRTIHVDYDALGRIEWVTNPLGFRTHLMRDSLGRVLAAQDTAGLVQFAYDSAGRLSAITPPSRPAHRFRYTPNGLLGEYEMPVVPGVSGTVVRYTYDADQHLRTITRPSGDSIAIAYDNAGRTTAVRTADDSTTFSFGPVTGHLTNVASKNGGAYALGYDGSLLTSMTLSGSPIVGTVAFQYDKFFRQVGIGVNGDTVSLTYDRDGLLRRAGALTLVRNAATGLSDSAIVGAVATAFRYDSTGAVIGATTTASGVALYDYALERDTLGRITRRLETLSGVTLDTRFAYDSAGRLLTVSRDGATVAAYGYDANGNRATRTAAAGVETAIVDAQDRLTSYGGAQYSYTDAGELQYRVVGLDTTQFHYDAGGALRWVRQQNGSRIDYVIDAVGRRVGKRVDGILVQGFLYESDLRIAAELAADGSVRSRFIYGASANVPEYMVRAGVMYRIVKDPLGSVRLVVDATTGETVQRIDYDEFGRILLNSNPGFQPFGYAGGLTDDASGLVRFGTRDYDPATGRWTAKDRSLFRGGSSNLYAYTSNDPVNLHDPSGRFPLFWALPVVSGVIGGVAAELREMRNPCATEKDFREAFTRGASAAAAVSLTVQTLAMLDLPWFIAGGGGGAMNAFIQAGGKWPSIEELERGIRFGVLFAGVSRVAVPGEEAPPGADIGNLTPESGVSIARESVQAVLDGVNEARHAEEPSTPKGCPCP